MNARWMSGSLRNVGTPVVEADADNFRIECTATFSATASGRANETVRWDGAEIRWFAGLDRTTPVQTQSLSGQEVVDFWNGGVLTSGKTATTVWRFWAGVPFILELDFRYSSGRSNDGRTASTKMECGLNLDVSGAPAPSISDLVVETPTPLEPRDTLKLSYRAASTVGLWETAIVISGAYNDTIWIPERLAKESRRSTNLVVPADKRRASGPNPAPEAHLQSTRAPGSQPALGSWCSACWTP
jgi:hypothetical protein